MIQVTDLEEFEYSKVTIPVQKLILLFISRSSYIWIIAYFIPLIYSQTSTIWWVLYWINFWSLRLEVHAIKMNYITKPLVTCEQNATNTDLLTELSWYMLIVIRNFTKSQNLRSISYFEHIFAITWLYRWTKLRILTKHIEFDTIDIFWE